MADPLLALIGAVTLIVLGAGALIALIVLSAQGFYSAARFVCKHIRS